MRLALSDLSIATSANRRRLVVLSNEFFGSLERRIKDAHLHFRPFLPLAATASVNRAIIAPLSVRVSAAAIFSICFFKSSGIRTGVTGVFAMPLYCTV